MKTSYTQRTLEFHKIYQSEILPKIVKHEDERKKQYIITQTVYGGTILVGIIFGVMSLLVTLFYCTPLLSATTINLTVYEDSIQSSMLFLLLFLVLLFLCSFVVSNIYGHKKFTNFLKVEYLQFLLKAFGDIKWCSIIKGSIISINELNDSDLFSHFNKRNTDDEFQGVHNGVPFKISETELIDERGSGKNRQVVRVFKGVIITFKSNKKNPSIFPTVIATKGDLMTKKHGAIYMYFLFVLGSLEPALRHPDNVFNWVLVGLFFVGALIASIIHIISYKQNYKDIKLEDPEFSKKFEVTSSDEVGARYLITTAFMERFKNLNTAFGAKKAKCSFFGDQIMFAISTNKDVFEIGSLNKSLKDPESINEFYNELSSILDMIEYFKLDEKTGL